VQRGRELRFSWDLILRFQLVVDRLIPGLLLTLLHCAFAEGTTSEFIGGT
jgi:hypothetical protein